MTPAETLSAALKGRAELTAEQAQAALEGWEIFDFNGAVVMRKGPEIHAAAVPEMRGKWITRAVIRAVLSDTIANEGKAVTAVMNDNEAGHAFVRRLGFSKTGADENTTHYRILKARHV